MPHDNSMDNGDYFSDLKPAVEQPSAEVKEEIPVKTSAPKRPVVQPAEGKVSCTYWITPELKSALKACSYFSGLTMTELAEEALSKQVKSIERKINGGNPFPRRERAA